MSSPNKVWIIDDDRSIRWVLERALKADDLVITSFVDADTALAAARRELPDVVVTDIRMPGLNGLEFVEHIHQLDEQLPVIVMTAYSDLDSAVGAYQSGAFEYLPKPFDVDDAVALVQKALKQKVHPEVEQEALIAEAGTEIIGEAPAMQDVFRAIGRLSHSRINVLINGESGTGKELVASALHRHSPRADKPFIALNVAAIPRDLMESELFGHEKGAFTGAQALRKGRFEQANGGTLFLDEIGDMPAELQTRLLRVLADGEFYRVGGHEPIKVDTRVIAATHQDLEAKVSDGSFREDLFHRLNVVRIRLPALRERREDIIPLVNFFLRKAAEELAVEPKLLTTEAEAPLIAYSWQGNVRQLENACRWITVMAPSREIHMEDLPEEVLGDTARASGERQHDAGVGGDWKETLRQWATFRLAAGDEGILKEVVPDVERIMIRVALGQTAGRKQDAARLLGWGRNTLTRKLKELDMPVEAV